MIATMDVKDVQIIALVVAEEHVAQIVAIVFVMGALVVTEHAIVVVINVKPVVEMIAQEKTLLQQYNRGLLVICVMPLAMEHALKDVIQDALDVVDVLAIAMTIVNRDVLADADVHAQRDVVADAKVLVEANVKEDVLAVVEVVVLDVTQHAEEILVVAVVAVYVQNYAQINAKMHAEQLVKTLVKIAVKQPAMILAIRKQHLAVMDMTIKALRARLVLLGVMHIVQDALEIALD